MSHDILQPIPQGGYGAYDEENRKIQGIADELQRLCRIHEEEFGDSQTNGGSLEIEQRISERYAKNHNLWIPIDYMFDLGVPGPSGNENDTYVSENTIFKVNNLFNSGSIVKLLEKILLHNIIFPNTFYKFYAFTGYDGRSIMPVLQQDRICDAHPATQEMINSYMTALGFSKQSTTGKYANESYIVWDIVPRNVLVDEDGDLYVVDAEICKPSRSE